MVFLIFFLIFSYRVDCSAFDLSICSAYKKKYPEFFSSKWKINAIVWQINWINSCSFFVPSLTNVYYTKCHEKKTRCKCGCDGGALRQDKIDCHHEIWWKSMRLLGAYTHTTLSCHNVTQWIIEGEKKSLLHWKTRKWQEGGTKGESEREFNDEYIFLHGNNVRCNAHNDKVVKRLIREKKK